ncbi:MAG: hypothetical protein JST68_06630 [Bacteroidetes bacterium]|nr:hypothetical protein [Bacteroidota bacterium]
MRRLIPFILLAFAACNRSNSQPSRASIDTVRRDTAVIASNPPIVYPDSPPTIADARLAELSGLAVSPANPGMVYVHNDSGDSSRFFALSPGGRTRATVYFNGDPAVKPYGVVDCEDMALAKGQDGQFYVFMGDIGDNDAVRKYIRIYRVKEPDLSKQDTVHPPTIYLASESLTLRYPDGARDAETLMADPVDRLLYIVSKREDSVAVYSTPLDFKAGDTVTLTRQTRLFFPGSGVAKWVTGGSIAHDGSQILLKTYSQVYYWKRGSATSVWKAMQSSFRSLPYTPEPQGEAIGFTVDGKGYYTVSEGKNPTLYHYWLP